MAKKDPREYGFEGEMVMSQLKGIMQHAEQMHDLLEPDTDLPEWVQSKVTLAYDYLQTAADYTRTEMSEDVVRTGTLAQRTQAYRADKAKKAGSKLPIDPDTNTPDHFTAALRRKKGLPEEAPVNSVGDGSGIKGLRPDSVGVKPAAMNRYKKKNQAEAPKAGRKTFSLFVQGK